MSPPPPPELEPLELLELLPPPPPPSTSILFMVTVTRVPVHSRNVFNASLLTPPPYSTVHWLGDPDNAGGGIIRTLVMMPLQRNTRYSLKCSAWYNSFKSDNLA